MAISKEKIYYITASIAYNLYQVLILILAGRIVDASAVGVLSFAYAVCAPVYMFFDFRLQFIILADSNKKNNFNFYFCARLFTCILSIILISIIAIIVNQNFETKLSILCIGIFKFFESLGEIFLTQKQREISLRETFYSKWIRASLGLFLYFFLLFLTKSILFGCAGLLLSSFLVFSIYEFNTHKIQINFSFRDFFRASLLMVKKYYYLGFVSLLASLSANVPRYALSYYWNMEKVGIYSILSYLSMGMVLFVTTSFQPFIPKISSFIRNRDFTELHSIMKKLLALFLGFGALSLTLITAYGSEVFNIIFNGEISFTRTMLFTVIVGGIFNYISLIMLYTLTSANLLKQQVFFYLGDIILISAACIFLIPKYSVVGACFAYLIVSVYHTICGVLYILYKKSYFKN